MSSLRNACWFALLVIGAPVTATSSHNQRDSADESAQTQCHNKNDHDSPRREVRVLAQWGRARIAPPQTKVWGANEERSRVAPPPIGGQTPPDSCGVEMSGRVGSARHNGRVTLAHPTLDLWDEPAPDHRDRVVANSSDRIAWLRARSRGVTATDVARLSSAKALQARRTREAERHGLRRQRLHRPRPRPRARDRPLGARQARHRAELRPVPRARPAAAPGDARWRRGARIERPPVRDQDDVARVAQHPAQLPPPGLVAAVRARAPSARSSSGSSTTGSFPSPANRRCAGSTATTTRFTCWSDSPIDCST